MMHVTQNVNVTSKLRNRYGYRDYLNRQLHQGAGERERDGTKIPMSKHDSF
jgi:hypothetical protein